MMESLYKKAWDELGKTRSTMKSIDPECTPVIAFGQWRTARVVTAGLNPSEREFRHIDLVPLGPGAQRFLHWPQDGVLTQDRLKEAFRRSEGYFNLGNSYGKWFGGYSPFLQGLGVSFEDGSACHTDYLSPFTTKSGISEHESSAGQLQSFGLPFWAQVLSTLPNIELVIGHGRGHKWMAKLFGFERWESVNLPFEVKTRSKEPQFLYQKPPLPMGREFHLFWWRPNLSGIPLSLLDSEKKSLLAKLVLERWKG